jgi:hypothetical protein
LIEKPLKNDAGQPAWKIRPEFQKAMDLAKIASQKPKTREQVQATMDAFYNKKRD